MKATTTLTLTREQVVNLRMGIHQLQDNWGDDMKDPDLAAYEKLDHRLAKAIGRINRAEHLPPMRK